MFLRNVLNLSAICINSNNMYIRNEIFLFSLLLQCALDFKIFIFKFLTSVIWIEFQIWIEKICSIQHASINKFNKPIWIRDIVSALMRGVLINYHFVSMEILCLQTYQKSLDLFGSFLSLYQHHVIIFQIQ